MTGRQTGLSDSSFFCDYDKNYDEDGNITVSMHF